MFDWLAQKPHRIAVIILAALMFRRGAIWLSGASSFEAASGDVLPWYSALADVASAPVWGGALTALSLAIMLLCFANGRLAWGALGLAVCLVVAGAVHVVLGAAFMIHGQPGASLIAGSGEIVIAVASVFLAIFIANRAGRADGSV